MCERVVEIVDRGLEGCEDTEMFLGTKAKVLTFVQTLEVRGVFSAVRGKDADSFFGVIM